MATTKEQALPQIVVSTPQLASQNRNNTMHVESDVTDRIDVTLVVQEQPADVSLMVNGHDDVTTKQHGRLTRRKRIRTRPTYDAANTTTRMILLNNTYGRVFNLRYIKIMIISLTVVVWFFVKLVLILVFYEKKAYCFVLLQRR